MSPDALARFAYETVGNPEKCHDFLAAFAEIIDAKAAAIAVADRQLRWASLCFTHGMDRATVDSYRQYYFGLNPWALHRPSTAGAVTSGDFETLSEKEFRDTEYYHGWYKPRGWLYAFSITLETTETECAFIFAIRPPNHPWREKEMAIVKDLAPHFAQATRLAKRHIELQNEILRYSSRALEIDILASLNLSPAESRIASALFAGQTVKEYAHSAGLTAETVRWHLKRIYKKLGIHHRDDFKQLLLERLKN